VASHLLRHRQFLAAFGLAVGALLVWPAEAGAQRHHRAGVRIGVGVAIGPHWYPRYGFHDRFYDPYYRYGQWYPPYGYRTFYGPELAVSSLRVQATPREAQVFVDGYVAGEVDDFDGIFQRLRLRPGPHEITVYLDGYRTERRALYFSPGTDQTVRLTLEPLRAGEVSEPPPPPSDPPDLRDRQQTRPPAPQPVAYYGALSIAVQPADAEVIVDGQPWTMPAEQGRLVIRLAEGRHTIEVRKEGYATYTETIGIGRDRTLTLNVSLRR
jgi:hypothetical protein